jgi:hypothetical protein
MGHQASVGMDVYRAGQRPAQIHRDPIRRLAFQGSQNTLSMRHGQIS